MSSKKLSIIKVPSVPGNPMRPLITKEMQDACIGRFFWNEDAPYFNENGDLIEHEAERVVPWHLCKEIYKRMAMVAAGINVPSLSEH